MLAMGEDKYLELLRRYGETYRFKEAGPDDFLRLAEEQAGPIARELYDQWILDLTALPHRQNQRTPRLSRPAPSNRGTLWTKTLFPPTTPNEQALWAAAGGLEAAYLGEELQQRSDEDRRSAVVLSDPNSSRLVRQAGLPHEIRALWVTRWDYRLPMTSTSSPSPASANFNALFFQVRGTADAYYNSQIEPWATRLSGGTLGQDPGWDPLAVAVNEGHARGLEVHAWINVYPAWLGETPPPPADPEPMWLRFNRLFGDDWVVWNRDQQPMQLNKEYLWSNPGYWAVQEHIAAVGCDIAAHYLIDGLHLDNVRYPGWEYSRDPVTLAAVDRLRRLIPPSTARSGSGGRSMRWWRFCTAASAGSNRGCRSAPPCGRSTGTRGIGGRPATGTRLLPGLDRLGRCGQRAADLPDALPVEHHGRRHEVSRHC